MLTKEMHEVFVMPTRYWIRFLAVVALAVGVASCNSYPLPGHLHYGRCGANAHTESYPHAKDAQRAYGCKSDDAGYLEGFGQGDQRRN